MNRMMPSTIRPGATTAADRLMVSGNAWLIIPPPAATRTSMNVPMNSENSRRHSCLGVVEVLDHRDELGLQPRRADAGVGGGRRVGVRTPRRRAARGRLLPWWHGGPPGALVQRRSRKRGGRAAPGGAEPASAGGHCARRHRGKRHPRRVMFARFVCSGSSGPAPSRRSPGCEHGGVTAPLDTSVRLSACLLDAQTGEELATLDPHAVRPTASVGKVLLLIEVARRLVHRELDPATLFTRTSEDAVADSGLWQHLHTRSLAVADLAVLVGAVSDNLATNVLLREIGLPAVGATGRGARVAGDTALHDRVRDHPRSAGSRHPVDRHRAASSPSCSAGCTAARSSTRRSARRCSAGSTWTPTCPWWQALSGSTRSPTQPPTGTGGWRTRRAPTPASGPTSGWSGGRCAPCPTPCWPSSMTPTGTRRWRPCGTGALRIRHIAG